MIKGINNLIKGRTIPDDVVGVLDDVMVKETDLVAKTINDTLDTAKINSKLKYTLAEALDDPDMLASQAAFENVKKLGYVNEFREFGRKQAEALNNYFGILKSGFGTIRTMKNVTPGKNVPNLTFDFYKKQVALFGHDNGLLYLFDKGDNSVFSVEARSGNIVKKHLPLLWPAMKLKLHNDYIIVQSDGHLYVIKNI